MRRRAVCWMVLGAMAGCGSEAGAEPDIAVMSGGTAAATGGLVSPSSGGVSEPAAGGDEPATGGVGAAGGLTSGGAITGGAVTGGTPSGACPAPDAAADSHCTITDTSVSCTHQVEAFQAGAYTRDVYWQRPAGEPPAAGYPVVFVYQGSTVSPSVTWGELMPSSPYGGFYQGVLQAKLLDAGFIVVAPEALNGFAWQTNTGIYDGMADDVLIEALIHAVVDDGLFGPVDARRVYATGISSGGYMTSRMAVSYPGIFRALAIQSGSYATCLGTYCMVPADLPVDHPPTLFLHGEADAIVPIATARDYDEKLRAAGHETAFIAEPGIGHAWLAGAPDAVLDWFCSHATAR